MWKAVGKDNRLFPAFKVKGCCTDPSRITALSSAAGAWFISCYPTTPIIHLGLQIAPHPRSAAANGYAAVGYSIKTWVTFYYQDIGYTLLTKSTLFTLNPTLDTIPWILFDCKSYRPIW
jgi:hypothetical protein